MSKQIELINYLLDVEHRTIAIKLKLITSPVPVISQERLYQAIGVIDYFSRNQDEKSKQMVIVLSSILYSYRQGSWTGLSQFLVIVLSRVGFAPSAIMVDDTYEKESNTFGSLGSFINQISTTINHLKNEITLNEKIYLLTDFQKEVWDKCSSSNFLGISAPTSAGKSFVILLKCIDIIINKGGNVVYVVPTLSLINQVVKDFHIKLQEFELFDYDIHTTYKPGRNGNVIYVLTPERAISAYSESDKPFGKVSSFIVDEIQNIERLDNKNDERSKILFDSLIELSFSYSPQLIIFSGPRVSGLKSMGFDIFNELKSNEISAVSSPVTNFTYSVSKKEKKYYFKQYSQINDEYASIEITNTENIKIGGKQYDEKYFNYLKMFLGLSGHDSKNIIFSPTSGTARKIAINLAKNQLEENNDDVIKSLIIYISNTVHPNYDLCNTLNSGIAYHHGKVPTHIRNVLEYSIKEKMIDTVVCTTTLMQGVNLPAQNVIMRNGYLSTKSKDGIMPKLTNYEISNLRGRAGRLLKDFIGRTFVLDENAFDIQTSNQGDLFQDENKKLKSGYGQIFNVNKPKISDAVFKNKSNENLSNDIGNDARFLITYIRYNVLKHGLDSLERLKSVGIDYTLEEVEQIKNELEKKLTVPVEICFKNRYVDPLIIDDIYNKIDLYNIPNNIKSPFLTNDLFDLVNKIRLDYPHYYGKFFKVEKELPITFFYTVVEWMKEKPLSKILSGPYFNNSDNIDSKIDQIQKDICFNLTSLLKPFFSMNNLDSSILSCVEMGGYKALTLRLISLNIPREVALILSDSIFKDPKISSDELDDKYVINVIRKNIYVIDFWNRIQLEHLI